MNLKELAKLKQIKHRGYLSVSINSIKSFTVVSNVIVLRVETPTLFGGRNLFMLNNPVSSPTFPFGYSVEDVNSLLEIDKSGYNPFIPFLILNKEQRLLARRFQNLENLKLLFNLAIHDEITRYSNKNVFRFFNFKGLNKTVYFPSLKVEQDRDSLI